MEWMYAFDIHCNAYFVLFLALFPLQLLLLPVLLRDGVLPALLANLLYAGAFAWYHYVSFLGYMYLPFLNKERVTALLYPVAGVAAAFAVLTVLNVNAAKLAFRLFI